MTGRSRRAFLTSLVAGSASLSGCIWGCGAAGPRTFDDVLRISVTEASESDGQFQFRAQVEQPGPEGWQYRFDRSEFNTMYFGVTLHAYAMDGEEVARRSFGHFGAGTQREREFQTERFPHVITASFGSVLGEYPGHCRGRLAGAHVVGYLGNHPDGVEDAYDRFHYPNSVDARPESKPTGHIWHPVGRVTESTDLPPADETFVRAARNQREVAGRNVDASEFSLAPDTEQWLRRRETYTLWFKRHAKYYLPDVESAPAAAVPDEIRTVEETIDWDAVVSRDVELLGERQLTREEFTRLYAILQGTTGELPDVGYDECPENVDCDNHWRGHPRGGSIVATYKIDLPDEPGAITLIYEWTGVRPEYLTTG